MNKPTKEEMLKAWSDCYSCYSSHLYGAPKYGPLYEAIRALIESSPEAGEQRVPSVAGELIDREYSEDDDGPTDLTPSDSEMQKHYDRGEMASSAPLPAEVEAAMKRIGTALDDAYYGREEYAGVHEASDKKTDDWAALATIRDALTEASQPKVVSREELDRLVVHLPLPDYMKDVIRGNAMRLFQMKGLTVGKSSEAEEPKP